MLLVPCGRAIGQEKTDQDRSMPEGAACEAQSPEGKAEHQQ